MMPLEVGDEMSTIEYLQPETIEEALELLYRALSVDSTGIFRRYPARDSATDCAGARVTTMPAGEFHGRIRDRRGNAYLVAPLYQNTPDKGLEAFFTNQKDGIIHLRFLFDQQANPNFVCCRTSR